MVTLSRSLFAAGLLLLLSANGCYVNTHKNDVGNDKDVSIGTPFGSLNVKTDQNNALATTGLSLYPGATQVHKHGDSSGAADVNLSFGGFNLGVHAVELRTPDPPDKVLAFYRKDMGRYGTVILCHGKHEVGEPSRTVAGLSCDSDNSGGSNNELELRAGSEQHQHVVSVNSEEGGTHIGLVALDLPNGLKNHTLDLSNGSKKHEGSERE